MFHKPVITPDLTNFCRTCLTQCTAQDLTKLSCDISLKNDIYEITRIQMKFHSSLPQGICKKCFRDIRIAMAFKKKVEHTEVQLQTVVRVVKETNSITSIVLLTEELPVPDLVPIKTRDEKIEADKIDSSESDIIIEKVEETGEQDLVPIEIRNETIEANTSDVNENDIKFEEVEVRCEEVPKERHISKLPCKKLRKCLYCDKEFDTIFDLNIHKRLDHVDKPCEICGKTFKSRECFVMHLRTHSEKRYMCDLCGETFMYSYKLRIHKRLHTGEQPFKCDICAKLFQSNTLLKIHTAKHGPERKFRCKKCPKAFKYASGLYSHDQRFHTVQTKYQCEECGVNVDGYGAFQRHSRMHREGTTHMCELCGKCYMASISLKRHKKKVHLRSYRCEWCTESFKYEINLDKHLKTCHKNVKHFKCNVCSKRFRLQNLLKLHKIRHKEENGEGIVELPIK